MTEINKQWIYVKRPENEVNEENYRLETSPIPTPKDGEILIKVTHFSVDPYMRIQQSSFNSWEEPHPLNTVQRGGTVGVVLESKDPSGRIRKGDIVSAYTGWQLYATTPATSVRKINPETAPPSTALGVLGMPGRTAYFGFLEAGKPKSGETVVVSGAAGAVGSIVVQIAKIKGCRVVGIAGSQAKLDWIKNELGADEVINYKTHNTAKLMLEALKKTCPNGIDIYFDNTGGYTTDAIFHHINVRARIIICGQISQYNGGLDNPEMGPRFLQHVLYKRCTIQGILARDYVDRMDEMVDQMSKWIKSGQIKYKETVVHGFDKLPQALNALFHGENSGKMVVTA